MTRPLMVEGWAMGADETKRRRRLDRYQATPEDVPKMKYGIHFKQNISSMTTLDSATTVQN